MRGGREPFAESAITAGHVLQKAPDPLWTFYDRPTLDVAPISSAKSSSITAAACAPAASSSKSKPTSANPIPPATRRPVRRRATQPLYGAPGLAYVYLNYGIHYLVNVVTEAHGSPAAMLIRALDPLDGVDVMRRRRGRSRHRAAVARRTISAVGRAT